MTAAKAIAYLMRIHYRDFMVDGRIWYDADARAADAIICKAASDLRLRG